MGRAEKIDSGANGEVIFYRSHYQISTKNGIDSSFLPDIRHDKIQQATRICRLTFIGSLLWRQIISPLTLINSATMLTAISSGVSELISIPMGA